MDLRAAVPDAFVRSLRPQLGMAGYRGERGRLGLDRGDGIVAGMARSWLRLRFGFPAEQASRAGRFPDAAGDALGRPDLSPKWRDLTEWSRRWHHPPRLRRTAVITAAGDRPELSGRLATPLVLGAGASVGPNMRRVPTMGELFTLAGEEGHCIASYADDLRRGTEHCLVIEREEAGRKVRPTLLIEERTRWIGGLLTLEPSTPYRVLDLRMYGNAPSPPEHWVWAKELVAAWCDVAARRAIRATTEETELRLGAWADLATLPDKVGQYWNEVTSACVPEWFLDFDPARGRIARLYAEFLDRERGVLVWRL